MCHEHPPPPVHSLCPCRIAYSGRHAKRSRPRNPGVRLDPIVDLAAVPPYVARCPRILPPDPSLTLNTPGSPFMTRAISRRRPALLAGLVLGLGWVFSGLALGDETPAPADSDAARLFARENL